MTPEAEPTTQTNKLLTIAMPCYNVEAYLERGLSSLADARLNEDLEVLIVNDGSTDATEAIAQRFVDKHPQIFRLITKKNGGHGSAINTGISNATGTYFRIVDGDDWVKTDNLVSLLDHLHQVGSDLVVDEKSTVDMLTENSHLIALPTSLPTDKQLVFGDICATADLEPYVTIHTLSVRTELLREHKVVIREGIFYVDYEFILKATCPAETIIFLHLEIYQYLIGNTEQSVAVANYVKRVHHHETMLKEILRFAEETSFEENISTYLDSRVQLVLHTHYNILLIFDTDRAQGLARAKEFRSWLTQEHPRFANATKKRYRQALLLHHLGFSDTRLNKLMGRN